MQACNTENLDPSGKACERVSEKYNLIYKITFF